MRLRVERFGAIVATDAPPALIWVDRALARAVLGADEHPLWVGDETAALDAPLAAPTEVHLMTTNRCSAGCTGCYTAAAPSASDAPTAALLDVIDRLAALGVFHVALGGGESLLRDDLFDIAWHARARGLVPNLTTSGASMTPALAERCRVFGQVNVSLDGLGATYRDSRGYSGATRALRAIGALRSAGVPTGANLVLSRVTFDAVEETVAALASHGANEVEVLRFKPSGRGADIYDDRKLTPDQVDRLLPMLLDIGRRHPSVVMKVDCSLVPFVCATDPDPAVLDAFGIFGCEAGNALAAVSHDLRVLPCSFLAPAAATDVLAPARWGHDPVLAVHRAAHRRAPEPCASCPYVRLCKSGCRAVSRHVTGDAFAPDPECPRVRAHAGVAR